MLLSHSFSNVSREAYVLFYFFNKGDTEMIKMQNPNESGRQEWEDITNDLKACDF